jgi:succinoglycan biosynthesis protein ExoM
MKTMLNQANSHVQPVLLRPSKLADISPRVVDIPLNTPAFGKVAICIPTCKRPENLLELLKTIRALDTSGADIHLIVVDNDAEESARGVIERAIRDSGIPLTYDCVPERSIPLVRNRLVKLANDIRADWIWFIDDDSLVQPDALQLMLCTAVEYDADCVAPHVPHIFEESERLWAQWSGLFEDRERPTGQPTSGFGTNGKLIRLSAVNSIPGPFDLRLRQTGGEDSLFFAHFRARGLRVVGCNEALLHDRVHPSRNNILWLTRRAMRIGLVKGFIIREVQPTPTRTSKWFLIGIGYTLTNLLMMVALTPLGPSRYFRYWIRASRGYGIAVGILFPNRILKGQEYSMVHGQ